MSVDYKKNFRFRSYLIDQCNRKNLVKTHGFYWANYRIWIMNYFCSKPSTSVKANVFLDVLEKKSRQNWTWRIFSNHIIARLPNNFGLFIIGIQSSFCHNTFSPMTCYLMTEKREKEKEICSQITALFSSFLTEKWKCLAKKEEKLMKWQLWCEFFSFFYSWFSQKQ